MSNTKLMDRLKIFSQEKEETKNIFEQFKEKYLSAIQKDIINLRIVQSSFTVWLEITKQVFSDSEDQIIYKIDLSFIKHAETKQLLFSPENKVEENASHFLDNCKLYLINFALGRYLFSQEACREMLINSIEEIESSEWQLF